MAERKETPRKVYPKSAIDSGCKCRLCGGIFEKARCKNLFKKGNEGRLRSAEIVNGGALICEEGFPHLLCRACERRLENFEKFRKVVRDVQNGLTREKRCTGVSPSAPVSRPKSVRSHNLDAASRRSLSFISSGISSETSMSQSTPDSESQPSQVG